MRVSVLLRTINNKNLETLKLVLNQAIAEAPQYLEKLKKEQSKIVYDKIEHLNKWYIKVIGLDEVKIYQERVTALQDQLLDTQNRRRKISTQLTEVRQQAQEIQNKIQHVDRKENFDVYCELINAEREVLNLERSMSTTFQEYDKAERDLFSAFTNAIRDSQEKQRTQLEYSKYIYIVLSIAGSFLAFLYTFFWRKDLKVFIDERLSAINGDYWEKNITEIIHHHSKNIENVHSKNIENLETKFQSEIEQNRNALENVLNILNSDHRKFLALPTEEENNPFFKTAISFIGIGFVGYIIGKLVIG